MSHPTFSDAFLEANSFSYDHFLQRTRELLDEGKATSGDAEAYPDLIKFTRLNLQRMERLGKQLELDPIVVEKMLSLPEKLTWVVLVEGWCGDVAQNLPVIFKMAEQTDNVDLKLLWRDEHPDIMEQYLTNGGRSIPKLIALRSSDLEELGTWGPRPEPIQEEMLRIKAEYKDRPKKEMVEVLHQRMHKWYADDKGQTLQQEFIGLLEEFAVKIENSPAGDG